MTERLWEVPTSWVWTVIKELGEIVSGGTPSTKQSEYWGGNIIWFAPSDLTGYKQKFISRGAKTLTEDGLANSSAKIMAAGSVMFSSRAPVGYVAINSVPAATNQGFKSVVPSSNVFNEYLYHYLKASRQLAEQRATGTTFKELSGAAFGVLPVPIPPLNEQRRIVQKVEALFAEIDKGVESLKTARTTLSLYRQSLLKSAFEGRLTADWRAQNAEKLEDPDTLLTRIKAEREARYKTALEDWQHALDNWRANGERGKKPPKPKWLEDSSSIKKSDGNLQWKIPKEWALVRPSDIAHPTRHAIGIGPFGSNLKVSDYTSSGVPLVFVRNITQEDFSLVQKFVSPEKAEELDAHSIKPGDVLITKMGDPPGDCTVYPDGSPNALITADCLKLRVWEDFADRKFVAFIIRSAAVKRQLGLITRGVAQKKISVERFKTVALPLPSLAEQAEIVRILDDRLEAADALEAEIDAALKRADALRQSILKKAFSGRLVPQDPDDEPAADLLARIKAERGKAPKVSRKRKASA